LQEVSLEQIVSHHVMRDHSVAFVLVTFHRKEEASRNLVELQYFPAESKDVNVLPRRNLR
jgi:hypothetical protein